MKTTPEALQTTVGQRVDLIDTPALVVDLDAMDRNSQTRSRYHQVTFEMIDLELGTIVWSGSYEMKKASQDNVLYR